MPGVAIMQIVFRLARTFVLASVLAAAAPAIAQKNPAAPAGAGNAVAPVVAPTQGGIFKCVDPNGNVTYGNVGDVKGCKRIETESINTIPSQRPVARPGDAKAPNRVEAGAQKGRDNDRRKILEEELSSEEKRLADLRREFNSGEPERKGDERNYQRYLDRVERLKADISRSEANVDSLRRELGPVRN